MLDSSSNQSKNLFSGFGQSQLNLSKNLEHGLSSVRRNNLQQQSRNLIQLHCGKSDFRFQLGFL